MAFSLFLHPPCQTLDQPTNLFAPHKRPTNRFYTYQFNDYNLALFNLRTRSLNALLYWLAQLFGSGLLGLLLDFSASSSHHPLSSRRNRAFLGWSIVLCVVFATWSGGWVLQTHYDRHSVLIKMDWSDPGYVGRAWLYIFYGKTFSSSSPDQTLFKKTNVSTLDMNFISWVYLSSQGVTDAMWQTYA